MQTRHADWRGDARRRRRAHGIAMNFSLPGLMSLLSLVNPDSVLLWRVSFAIAALGGAVIMAVLRGAGPTRFWLAAYTLAITLYALIAVLAIAPGIVAGIGLPAAAVRVAHNAGCGAVRTGDHLPDMRPCVRSAQNR